MKVSLIPGLLLVSIAPASFAADSDTATGKMLRANTQIHVVANLDKSIEFFQKALGLELSSKPAPLANSTLLAQAMAQSKGARARAASFHMPGSEMTFMLIEFSRIERKTLPPQRLYDPGVVRFSIQVRDIDAAFARVRPFGVPVLSTGGSPVFTQRPRNNTRAVMMRDPDGFIFEFVQADPLPATDVPASSNLYNVRASPVVEDVERSLVFYRDILGFKARPTNTVNDAVLALEGTPTAVARTTLTEPPGSTNFWVLWEFSKIDRQTIRTRAQDPGSPALSIWVENLPALLKTMKSAGIRVETPGGEPIGLGPTIRGVLVRSPDGLLIELLEKTS
jgi:catechol 2,3-dioxygenase-like lactoylglutathione lyase family enzyme